MDALRRDVRALHLENRDMDWLFCSNNPLAPELAAVSLPCDFKVPRDMFKGRMDPRAHLMQYNDYMNVLGALKVCEVQSFLYHAQRECERLVLVSPPRIHPRVFQLGQMFLGRLRAHGEKIITPTGLMSVKQREGESLQNFVKQFHAATLNTKNLEDQ